MKICRHGDIFLRIYKVKLSQAKTRIPSENLDKKIVPPQNKDVINVFNNDKKGEYYFLKLDQLIPFHDQARIYFDEEKIVKLSVTIKKHGLRQPLTVLKSTLIAGKYEIISGERRYRAAKLIGLDRVPCIVLNDHDNAEEIALIENIQREDLHPIELGRAYHKLYNAGFCKTHNEIAQKLSIPRSQVTEFLSFAEIAEESASTLIQHGISERKYLRQISSIKNSKERTDFIYNLINDSLTNTPKKSHSSKNKGIPRKANIVSFSLVDGVIEMTHKPLEKLREIERSDLKEKLTGLLNELSTN